MTGLSEFRQNNVLGFAEHKGRRFGATMAVMTTAADPKLQATIVPAHVVDQIRANHVATKVGSQRPTQKSGFSALTA
ncbi:MAG: hypothetical protein CMP22_01190 [Rickettsiales bacterium]|nr:hypothetical protein [Rickettsiales bacterium]